MNVGCTASETFFDNTNIPKKILDTAGLSVNYDKPSLHVLFPWIHSMFPEERALKVASSRIIGSNVQNHDSEM